jgi:hypothetical protein
MIWTVHRLSRARSACFTFSITAAGLTNLLQMGNNEEVS